MALVTHSRRFGSRAPYQPAQEHNDFDERRGELDWHYIQISTEVFEIMLRQLQSAINEIPREVTAVRKLPIWERRRSPVVLDLSDLFTEVFKSAGSLQSRGPDFAKIIVEIEDRIANAQRYAAEHEVHKREPRE